MPETPKPSALKQATTLLLSAREVLDMGVPLRPNSLWHKEMLRVLALLVEAESP